jgi:SAM-dependent methyltransferase
VPKYDAREISALFAKGENIMRWVRARESSAVNSPTAILYSYDMQAGSYIERMSDPAHRRLKEQIAVRIAPILDGFSASTLLDAGVGEATTLAPILAACRNKPRNVFAFDISVSRLLYARSYLTRSNINASVFTAELNRLPFEDNAIDVILTVHALEPNHGDEEPILKELLRVCRKGLILVEPSWELGSAATRARIERLGYVRGLPEILERLGHKADRCERLGLDVNPENEAAVIVVTKSSVATSGAAAHAAVPAFVSPISGRPLVSLPQCLFCPDDGHAFPILEGIPCLTVGSGILASKLRDFIDPQSRSRLTK